MESGVYLIKIRLEGTLKWRLMWGLADP